jgi:Tol biopolymer transport system component
MGEVYRARDTRLGRDVAVKILPKEMSADAARKQRFEREAKTISGLNHPNICTLHDVGSQDGVDYLVMECVEGETLAKRLEKGPLPLEQVLKYGAQIADALDKAHRAGIVHRDLKPGNIMLTSTGVKLLDFGLAKPVEVVVSGLTLSVAAVRSSPVTQEGTVVGTFQYMSPEQVEGKEVDGRSDIFSLGAVLYEMLTGKRAFEGKSHLSVASAILEKEPAAMSEIKPMTPPALDHAVRKCLAKVPEERWQSAADLGSELKWVSDTGWQAGALAISARKSGSLREWIAWGVVAILLCALAGVAILSFNKNGAPVATTMRSEMVPPTGAEFAPLDLNAGAPAISPDGRQVVVAVRNHQGKLALWLRSLSDVGEGRLLPGTQGGGHPFWSADSRSIGFFAEGKLKRIDADGSSLQTLCDGALGRGGTWNAAGIILFASSVSAGISEVSASGGTVKPVTELDRSRRENSHRWPVFLPDGRHFLFFIRNFQPEGAGLYLGSLGSKEYHQVAKTYVGPAFEAGGTLVFVRDGAVVTQEFDERKLTTSGEPVVLPDRVGIVLGSSNALFSVSRCGQLTYYPALPEGGPYALTWYDRSGKRGEPLDKGYFYGPALSPNGTQGLLPIVNKDGLGTDLWSFDLARGTKTRLTSEPGNKSLATWEPSGHSVLFSSSAKGSPHIYRIKSDGTGATETVLETEGTVEYPGSVCRDGRYLVYSRSQVGSPTGAIWILPLFGEGKPYSLVESRFVNLGPTFSPDCKWVAYTSNETGQNEIYVTQFPGGGRKYQVSKQGGQTAHWRGDGKELFYFSAPQNSIMAVGVEERGEEVSLGAERELFQLANPNTFPLGSMFDVTADGQRFLISEASSPVSGVPLKLVANWDAELKKK